MLSFLGFVCRLFGREDDGNGRHQPPSYASLYSESQSSEQSGRILSGGEVPTRDEFPWVKYRDTNSPRLENRSNTQITTTQTEPQSYSNSSKLPQKPIPSSTLNTKGSNSLPLHESAKIAVSERKTVAKDIHIKLESNRGESEKLREAFEKPMILPTSPKLSSVRPNFTIDADARKAPAPKPSINAISFCSKSTSSSSKPSVSSSSQPLSALKPETSYLSSSGTLLYNSPVPHFLSGEPPPSQAPPNPTVHQKNSNHIWVEKGSFATNTNTDNVKDLIKNAFLPGHPYHSSKPTLCQAPFNPTLDQQKSNYFWVEKGTSSAYKVPENVEDLIKKEILPGVLKKSLSPSTYKDFFHTLLYAEDFYLEKWDGFEMENVTLEIENAVLYSKKGEEKNLNKLDLEEEDAKVFVAFEMDSVPQKRPFLLSRDFASVRPSGSGVEPFQGVIYRVVKSNRVLVEFGEDFHSRHHPNCKYDVRFSFNRTCLKRTHQAIDAVSDRLLKNFLFPSSDCSSSINPLPRLGHCIDRKLDREQISAVSQICSHHGPPPYLVEGPLCVTGMKLSRTGVVISEAVFHTYRTNPDARILICAPTNATCDVLVKNLQEVIPESAIFRANAAFREREEVLSDILGSCRIEEDCFSCPPLEELQKFKIISSTYMTCFRLHNEGLVAGEFSHMFMLDASSTTEPETLVALAYFADESTNVVITGQQGNCSRWVRSPMARRQGLMRSYFERLCESNPKHMSEL